MRRGLSQKKQETGERTGRDFSPPLPRARVLQAKKGKFPEVTSFVLRVPTCKLDLNTRRGRGGGGGGGLGTPQYPMARVRL